MTQDRKIGDAVRAFMKANNRGRVWQNLHPNIRSVKCYASNDRVADYRLLNNIAGLLQALGCRDATLYIKEHDRTKGWGPADSIIVRIPR